MNKKEARELIEVYRNRLKRKLTSLQEKEIGLFLKEKEALEENGRKRLETDFDNFMTNLKKSGLIFDAVDYHKREARRSLGYSIKFYSKKHQNVTNAIDSIRERHEKRKETILSSFNKTAELMEEEIILQGLNDDVKKKFSKLQEIVDEIINDQ